MSKPFNLPPLGENVESGTIVGILVSVGDTLVKDQGVLEIETDKATLEVPSSVEGVITEILVSESDQAEVGKPVLLVEESAVDDGGAEQSTTAQPAAEPDTSAAEIAVSPGPQAVTDVTEEPTVGSVAPPTGSEPDPEFVTSSDPSSGTPVPAAPSVRRFAREIGIDIGQVTGTGPSGRISVEDVKAFAKQVNTGSSSRAAGAAQTGRTHVPLPDFSKWGPVDREPVTNLRRAAAEHLGNAWSNIPHVTYADKADITELEKLRKHYAPLAEDAGGKLTMTAIALKFAVAALRKFPQFNASIDMDRQEIIYKKYYHLGVAVDTDRGLVVPVIRDVDQKSIIDLTVELSEVARTARDRKLSLEDMQGSTFTVTNLGGFGGEYFTPIINAPDVAILGIARGHVEPVYIGDSFQPRLRLPLMISYDHRLIDGADGARFLKWLIEAFEQPFLLSLEG